MNQFHPLESQAVEGCDFAAQVVDRMVVDQNAMSFQETVQLVTRAKTE